MHKFRLFVTATRGYSLEGAPCSRESRAHRLQQARSWRKNRTRLKVKSEKYHFEKGGNPLTKLTLKDGIEVSRLELLGEQRPERRPPPASRRKSSSSTRRRAPRCCEPAVSAAV